MLITVGQRSSRSNVADAITVSSQCWLAQPIALLFSWSPRFPAPSRRKRSVIIVIHRAQAAPCEASVRLHMSLSFAVRSEAIG